MNFEVLVQEAIRDAVHFLSERRVEVPNALVYKIEPQSEEPHVNMLASFSHTTNASALRSTELEVAPLILNALMGNLGVLLTHEEVMELYQSLDDITEVDSTFGTLLFFEEPFSRQLVANPDVSPINVVGSTATHEIVHQVQLWNGCLHLTVSEGVASHAQARYLSERGCPTLNPYTTTKTTEISKMWNQLTYHRPQELVDRAGMSLRSLLNPGKLQDLEQRNLSHLRRADWITDYHAAFGIFQRILKRRFNETSQGS